MVTVSALRSKLPAPMHARHRGHMPLSCAPALNSSKLWFGLQLSLQARCSALLALEQSVCSALVGIIATVRPAEPVD